MYKIDNEHQLSFYDFNLSCGMQLDTSNEWIKLAERIPSLGLRKWNRTAIFYRNRICRIVHKAIYKYQGSIRNGFVAILMELGLR